MEQRERGIFNCDWFSFTADFTRYSPAGLNKADDFDPEANSHLARLFERLDEQREKVDGGFIDLGLFSFEVLNHGSRSYYYILHNDDMQIQFAKHRSKNLNNYPVYVHFKSQFLWAEIYSISSLDEKFRLVIQWLEDVLNGKYIESKINRLDLAYHTDDVPDDFNAEQFVGYHTLDTTRRTHRVVTGIDIGSRKSQKIFLRCYNKYLEARASKKSWFFAIWEEHGLNVRKVWNIEFQMNREFFGEFKVGNVRLDTAEQVIELQSDIWAYLTSQWVSYRVPDDERRSRWSLHPWWQSLSSYHESKNRLSRSRQRELPTADMIIPGLRGYLSSYAARMGYDIEDGTLFRQLFEDIHNYERVSSKDWNTDVNKKLSLLDPEGVTAEAVESLIDNLAYERSIAYDTVNVNLKHRATIDIKRPYRDQGLLEDRKIADADTSTTKKAPKNSVKSPVSPTEKGCQLELFGI